jgi:GT2 family glycosyltransferase
MSKKTKVITEKVCCVILNYNDSRTTINLIENIKHYSTISNIVVVDNNSTDNSYEKLCGCKSEKVHVIETVRNGGYGFGNNYGIRYAKENWNPEYIIIANPDVEFSEACVEQLLKTLGTVDNAVIASAVPYFPNGKMQSYFAWELQSAQDYLLKTSSTFSKLMKSKYISEGELKKHKIIEVDCVSGAMFMVKTDEMIEFGMYDEDVFLYGEETILGMKFKKANLKTLVVSNVSYVHKHSNSINLTYKSTLDKRKLQRESMIIVLEKYYRLGSFKLSLAKKISIICLFEAWFRDLVNMVSI